MIQKYCFIILFYFLNTSNIFSDESLCGEEPKFPKDIINNKNFFKELDAYYEYQACVSYEVCVKNGVWIPVTIWGPPEIIKFSKKRRLKLKGLDVKIKNIPQDWIVYKLYFPRDSYPLDRTDCPDQSYYFTIENKPIIELACGEPYDRNNEADLEKRKGIEIETKFSGHLRPKNGKYYREVFYWSAHSYKKNKYTCNTVCAATVDLEYKDWFLKNIYFRLE